MKEDLVSFVNDIEKMQSKFRHFISVPGSLVPSRDLIYDNPDFIDWKEGVLFELQDIYDRTNDKYIWKIICPTGVIHRFNGKCGDERDSFYRLSCALKQILKHSDKYYPHEVNRDRDGEGVSLNMKRPMLFISHSSNDLLYVQPFVELFADIGLNNQTMFCSSVPDYHIPMDEDIYDYLKNLFNKYDLHVIFMLSKNYYQSAACLNEMGAAWVLQKRYSSILLPGFKYEKMRGAVNPTQISLKLDSGNIDEVKARLGDLKNIISKEFEISVPEIRWETKRDQFIQTLNSLRQDGGTL